MAKRRLARVARNLLIFGIGFYGLMLALYLLLRLLWHDPGPAGMMALANTFAFWLFVPLIGTVPLALIFWYKGYRRWHGLPLQSVLALIALVWLVIPMLPPPTPEPTPGATRLTVVTLNVWASNRDIDHTMDWLLESGAHVLVLSEMNWPIRQQEPLLRAFPYVAQKRTAPVIYSRFPIIDFELLWLGDDGVWGIPNIYALLDVPGQPVSVYGIHFPSPKPGRRDGTRLHLPLGLPPPAFLLDYDEYERNSEIRRLLEHVKQDPNPVIVAGDFNLSAYSLPYDSIAAVLTDSFAAVGSGGGKTWPVSSARRLPSFLPPLLRIDYVWHSAAFRSLKAELGPFVGSDHLPLAATLEMVE